MDEQVTIPKEEFDRLMEADRKLRALEGGGVDNWEGYEPSMQEAGLMD